MRMRTSPKTDIFPKGVQSIEAFCTNHDSITLTWTDAPEVEASTVEIWRKTWSAGSAFAYVASEDMLTGSYEDTTVSEGTAYTYQVRTCAANGAPIAATNIDAQTYLRINGYKFPCLAPDGTVYAVHYDSGNKIYKSTDGGLTWTFHWSDPTKALVIVSMFIDKQNTLYVAGSNGTIYGNGKVWRLPAGSAVASACQLGGSDLIINQGAVNNVQVTAGGSAYSSDFDVTFTGGGGTGATGLAKVSGGAITQIRILTKGSGYTSDPTVDLSLGDGADGAATAYTKTSYWYDQWAFDQGEDGQGNPLWVFIGGTQGTGTPRAFVVYRSTDGINFTANNQIVREVTDGRHGHQCKWDPFRKWWLLTTGDGSDAASRGGKKLYISRDALSWTEVTANWQNPDDAAPSTTGGGFTGCAFTPRKVILATDFITTNHIMVADDELAAGKTKTWGPTPGSVNDRPFYGAKTWNDDSGEVWATMYRESSATQPSHTIVSLDHGATWRTVQKEQSNIAIETDADVQVLASSINAFCVGKYLYTYCPTLKQIVRFQRFTR